jgi:hypothetical protein
MREASQVGTLQNRMDGIRDLDRLVCQQQSYSTAHYESIVARRMYCHHMHVVVVSATDAPPLIV